MSTAVESTEESRLLETLVVEVARGVLVQPLAAFAGLPAFLRVFEQALPYPSPLTESKADSKEYSGQMLTALVQAVEQGLNPHLSVPRSSPPTPPHL
jgi:hypothetical protein